MINFTDILDEDSSFAHASQSLPSTAGQVDGVSSSKSSHRRPYVPFMPNLDAPSISGQYSELRETVKGLERTISIAEKSMDNMYQTLAVNPQLRRLQVRAEKNRSRDDFSESFSTSTDALDGHGKLHVEDFLDDRGVELLHSPQANTEEQSSPVSSPPFAHGRRFANTESIDSDAPFASAVRRPLDDSKEVSTLVSNILAKLSSFRDQRVAIQIQKDQIRREVQEIRGNLPALLHHLMHLAEDIMKPHSAVRLFHLRVALRALPANNIQHRDSVAIDMARYYADKLRGEHAALHERVLRLLNDRTNLSELNDVIATSLDAWVDWEFDLQRAVVLAGEHECVDQRRPTDLTGIDKRVIAEVRSFRNPTKQLVRIVHATLLVLGYPVAEKKPNWQTCCQHFCFKNQREILRRMQNFSIDDLQDVEQAHRVLRKLFRRVDKNTAQHSNRHTGSLYRWLNGIFSLLNSTDDLKNMTRVFGALVPVTVTVTIPQSAITSDNVRSMRKIDGVYDLVPNVLFHDQVVYRRQQRFDDHSGEEMSLCFAEGRGTHWSFRAGSLEDADHEEGGPTPSIIRSVDKGLLWPIGIHWEIQDSNEKGGWREIEHPICTLSRDE